MRIEEFKQKALNIDTTMYRLQVKYAPIELTTTETLQYTDFLVYHSLDTNTVKFVAAGFYTKKKEKKEFKLIVEEMEFDDYNSSHIHQVFFDGRSTITGLVQAFHNGYVPTIAPVEVKPEVKVIEPVYDDTFTKEDLVAPVAIKEESSLPQYEPVIIQQKKKGGRPPVKKPTAKK